MGSKIGLILSLIFVSIFFVLGGDLICLQYLYGDLDTKGVTISYLISKTGRVDDSYRLSLEEKYNVTLRYYITETPRIGDVIDFSIETTFNPIVLSNDSMTIKINRSAILGYYG